MSDFTDFFPVSGGSGVGSGIPINGYFPFIVSSTGFFVSVPILSLLKRSLEESEKLKGTYNKLENLVY